ncbi:MAG: hypothetical protein A2070_12315 [Bdellovibrionales bacterium GWC1_52_8]|nr:MAG: hypothetical protein A2Z97_09185 [Bdellovibrionales bacterium GWB1_52_6]OFZ05414.1 MAG: hypothetical protein A2X97_11070 [Bdellovibrionales bacterium GWA1_52_35]OFZ32797.1 MAG: hypothetical protein A2070_12315 [Bdellovibrionales bacterium GWC1_52_8]
MSARAHFLARFGAFATSFGAKDHLLVTFHFFAGLRATGAGFCTKFAALRVKGGPRDHELGTCFANACTILQYSQVGGLRMLTPFVHAVLHRFEADLVAFKTVFDAFIHGDRFRVRHEFSL